LGGDRLVRGALGDHLTEQPLVDPADLDALTALDT
jgi:hypothetical protein